MSTSSSSTDQIDFGSVLEAMQLAATRSASASANESAQSAAQSAETNIQRASPEPYRFILSQEDLDNFANNFAKLQDDKVQIADSIKSMLPETHMKNCLRPVSDFLTSSSVVRIYVGPERKMWTLNEDLLCDRIDYFRLVFKGRFMEADKKELSWPEDHVGAFAKFVDWIYTGQVEFKECAKTKDNAKESFGAEHEIMWCSLWVLADRVGALELEKLALAKIKECLNIRRITFGGKFVISAEAVKYVYENTHDHSKRDPSPLRERNYKLAEMSGGNGVVLLEFLEAVNKHTSHKDCWQKKYCYFHGGKCFVCKAEAKTTRREKKLAKLAAEQATAAAAALAQEEGR